jgi:glucokinase
VQDCKIVKFSVQQTPSKREDFQEVLISKTKELLAYAGEEYKRHKISHIGVSTIGPADYKQGIIMHPHNLPFLKEFNIKRLLSILKLPIKVENDANCFALAQAVLDKNPSRKNVFGVTLGTGIGGGLCIDEKIYKGRGNAGEIGHWSYGDKRFEDEFQRIKEEYAKKLKVEDFQGVGKAAKKGNKVALEGFQRIGTLIGELSRNIILAYDPDVIVFGGGLSYSWSLLKRHIIRAIKKRNGLIAKRPIIKRNTIPKANLLGASLLTKY